MSSLRAADFQPRNVPPLRRVCESFRGRNYVRRGRRRRFTISLCIDAAGERGVGIITRAVVSIRDPAGFSPIDPPPRDNGTKRGRVFSGDGVVSVARFRVRFFSSYRNLQRVVLIIINE